MPKTSKKVSGEVKSTTASRAQRQKQAALTVSNLAMASNRLARSRALAGDVQRMMAGGGEVRGSTTNKEISHRLQVLKTQISDSQKLVRATVHNAGDTLCFLGGLDPESQLPHIKATLHDVGSGISKDGLVLAETLKNGRGLKKVEFGLHGKKLELLSVAVLGQGAYGKTYGVLAQGREGLIRFCAKTQIGGLALDEALVMSEKHEMKCTSLIPSYMAHETAVAVMPWAVGTLRGMATHMLSMTQIMQACFKVREALECLGKLSPRMYYFDVKGDNTLLACNPATKSLEVYLGDLGSLTKGEGKSFSRTYRLPRFWEVGARPGKGGLATDGDVKMVYHQLTAVMFMECILGGRVIDIFNDANNAYKLRDRKSAAAAMEEARRKFSDLVEELCSFVARGAKLTGVSTGQWRQIKTALEGLHQDMDTLFQQRNVESAPTKNKTGSI